MKILILIVNSFYLILKIKKKKELIYRVRALNVQFYIITLVFCINFVHNYFKHQQ